MAPESFAVIAYCSTCGSRTATRQVGNQLLSACPDCDKIFFRNPKVVVTALIEDQGRVLLVLRDIEPGRGLWGLPGGFVDWDEHPEVAMVRECREEVLVTVEPIELLPVQHLPERPRPAPRRVLLLARDHEARAHDAAVRVPALADPDAACRRMRE